MNLQRLKDTDWRALVFFAATAVILEAITTYSSIDVFPAMKGKILCAFAATVILAYLIHDLANEADKSLRQRGTIIFCILNAALLYNALQHFDYGRELNASTQSVAEINLQADKDLEREQARATIAQQIADANAKQLKAGRDTLLHTPRQQAGKLIDRLQSALITAPQASPTPTTPTGTPARIKTPAELRAELMPNLFWSFVFSFVVSVLGATYLFAYRQWDRDGDGVKDWIQRAAKALGETKFAEAYPEYYGLYSNQLFPKA